MTRGTIGARSIYEAVASRGRGEREGIRYDRRFRPIGFVRTHAQGLPRHWSVSGVEGELVIHEEYSAGLRDIDAGQRIVVIFYFHRSPVFSSDLLLQTSGQHGREMGVFSLCSPVRPNPIGMSVLEVLGTRSAIIDVRGLDMLDGTPILDIKPHIVGPRG